MWYWHGMGFWGWIMMLAFWALVILLIIWAVRPQRTERPAENTALHILDERLAKGEIDPEEYQERRLVLEARR